MQHKNKPLLYLIPVPISEENFTERFLHIPIVHQLKHFIVEDVRTAKKFLKLVKYPHNFEDVWFYELNEHNEKQFINDCISPLREGYSVGLLSEAGVPCVADPGYTAVRFAHESNFTVAPLPGESSLILALMSSGLQGQKFIFHGYLPIKQEEIRAKLSEIESFAKKGYTQLFIETPYRNERLLDFLLKYLSKDIYLCLATSLMSSEQDIQGKTIAEWKKHSPSIKNKPTVFVLGY